MGNKELTDHDLLIETHEGVKYLKDQFGKIEEGKLGTCVKHNERISNIVRSLNSLWGVVTVIALTILGAVIHHFLI